MAISGRSVRISRAGANVVGARTDSVTINNEPLDITDKDNSGWRTMLADVGLRTVSCEIEGVLKDTTLLADGVGTASTALLKECVVTISGLGTLTGDFFLQGIQIGAEQADVVTFTATLESGEAMTATIGPYNTVLPAITGDTQQGSVLTTTNGTWAGDATITYARQWQRAALGPELVTNGTFPSSTTGWASGNSGILSISTFRLQVENGASNFGYAIQSVSVVVGRTYRVRATLASGTGVPTMHIGAASGYNKYGTYNSSVDISILAVEPTIDLTVGNTSAVLGATCIFDNISVMEEPHADKPWSDIASATGLTYTLAAADVGKYLRCRVTATNGVGSTIAYSNILGPIT